MGHGSGRRGNHAVPVQPGSLRVFRACLGRTAVISTRDTPNWCTPCPTGRDAGGGNVAGLRRAASLRWSGPDYLTPSDTAGAEPAPRGHSWSWPPAPDSLRAGRLFDRAGVDDVLVFLIPCVINGAMLIYFLTGFRSHVWTEDRAGGSDADLPSRPLTPCEGRSHASENW